jgi:O-antigen/teichoic acid export membrane protein
MTSDDSRIRPIEGSVLARNTLLNMATSGVPLVLAIILVPQIVRGLGTERFGILALAWVLIGYLTLFDLGIGRATARYVADALGRGDNEETGRTVWTAVLAQTGLGVFGAVLVLGLAPFLVERVLQIPRPLVAPARQTFWILSLAVPAMLVAASFRGVLEAAQRFGLVNALRLPASLSTLLIPFAGVLLGWPLPGIAVGMVVAQILSLVGHAVVTTRVFPELRRARPDRARLGQLLSFGGWTIVPSVTGPALAYLDRFVIGAILSIAAVAYYSAPAEMVGRLWILPASLITTLFPAYSRLHGAGNVDEVRRLVVRGIKYLLILVGPPALVLATYARPILRLWLGPDFADNSGAVLETFAITAIFASLALLGYSLIQAVGRPEIAAGIDLVQVVPYVILLWFFTSWWGLLGSAIAGLIKTAAIALALLIAAARLSLLSVRSFAEERVTRQVALLAGLGLLLVGVRAFSEGAATDISASGLVLVIFAWATWTYVLSAGERLRVREVLHLSRRVAEVKR